MRSVEEIEKWVEDTLRLKGFDYGCKEENVFLLLRHLFCAVAMYDDMDAYNRAIVDVYVKKFKSVFNSKFSLKERKRNKQKKEKVSPNPLLKDKETNKEIEQKEKNNKKNKNLAAMREAENLKREQEYAENKRKAVSYEEVAKTMGEGGALAKLKRISSTPKK